MSEQKVLKGVYKEGGVIASVIQKDDTARIMVKGAEPSSAGDTGYISVFPYTSLVVTVSFMLNPSVLLPGHSGGVSVLYPHSSTCPAQIHKYF